MILRRYGGPWQEFRAYVATVLFGWAQSVHFAATMDLAKMLAAIEAEAKAADEAERAAILEAARVERDAERVAFFASIRDRPRRGQ